MRYALVLLISSPLFCMEQVCTQYDQAKDQISEFMQHENIDESFPPEQELALLLLNPQAAQLQGLPFSEFKEFYRGIADALKIIKEMQDYLPACKTQFISFLEKSCIEVATTKNYQDLTIPNDDPQDLLQLPALITILAHFDPTHTDKSLVFDKTNFQQQRMAAETALKIPGKRTSATRLLKSTTKALDETLEMGNLYEEDLDWLITEIATINNIPLTEHDFASQEDRKRYLKRLITLSQKALMLKQCPKLVYCRFDEELGVQEIDMTATYFVQCLMNSCINKSASPRCEKLRDYVKDVLEETIHDASLPQKTLGRTYALHKLKRFVQAVRYMLGDCTPEETTGPSFENPIDTTTLGEKNIPFILKEHLYLLEIIQHLNSTINKLL